MAETVYKAKKPFKQDGKHYYPITTHDQIIMPDGNRWDGQHLSSDIRDDAVEVGSIKVNADLLGGKLPEYYKNATTLGGVAAKNYALKTDIAPDSTKLGGKAPEYYLQPRNLLDNSNFRNPVNQRGATSYSGIYTYSIDRWVTWLDSSSPATVTVDAGGITPYPGMVIQRIESKYIDSSKTYTFAAMTRDGLLVLSGKITTSTDYGSTNANNGIYFNYYADDDVYQFVLAGLTSASKFVWAALYEGEYTADNLPPYVPKGYTAELAECQRYYYESSPTYYGFTGSSGNIAYIYIELPQIMRITPSFEITGTFFLYLPDGSDPKVTAVSEINMYNKQVELVLQSSDLPYEVPITGYLDETIKLSADL